MKSKLLTKKVFIPVILIFVLLIGVSFLANKTIVASRLEQQAYQKEYDPKPTSDGQFLVWFEPDQEGNKIGKLAAFIGADFYLKIADVPHEINGVKITEIRENTFAGVLSLEKIILPQTIVSIGNQAVSNCKNLKEMYVPASVTTISKTAFEGTGNFIMYVEEGSYAETFAKSNNIEYKHYIPKPLKPIPTEDLKAVFGGQYKEFIYDMIYYNNVPMCAITFSNWQGNKTKDVVVPAQFNGADVTVLMTRAIDFGDNIETITLPDTVIAIDDEAFSACSNLKKVYFTENVTFIGKSVFKSYPNVTICAPKDSYAHRYAIENKINFEETPNTN